jgi:hypothetical protein
LSKSNYNTYKVTQNAQQKSAYDSAMKKTYTVSKKQNMNTAISTRPQRITVYNNRPTRIYVNTTMFPGSLSYGSAYCGVWDLWFLTRASDAFWYHHWAELSMYNNYFDAATWAARERAMTQMRAQNMAVNADYLDPDVDPDLQFSPQYQEEHLDRFYTSPPRRSNAGWIFLLILLGLAAAGGIGYYAYRRYNRVNSNSGGIY